MSKKKQLLPKKTSLGKQPQRPRKKKALGQHFLRKQSVVDHMITAVTITPKTSVLEIGCGDGFLTKAILEQTSCKRLWSYEIDPEWAAFTDNNITDRRLTIKEKNILEINWNTLSPHRPWIVLSNLPYQITFPILFLLQQHKALFSEGVVMIQEEVAQKIVAKKGKGYNATSLFLQYHISFKLMEKIEPGAFTPPPKIFSRLVYFKPKLDVLPIANEEGFWKFVKLCFQSPRRTLRNNLKQTHYSKLPETLLTKRAQELSFDDFLTVWQQFS